MKIVTVNIPEAYLDSIEKLVGNKGLYPSRSELIRVAVRDFLLRELKMANNMAKYKELKEEDVEEIDDENYVRVPVEKLNEKDEPIREFKTYKIIKRLSYNDPLKEHKIDHGEFTGKNQSYDDIPLPANHDPPSLDKQRTRTPDESFVKFINEV